MVRIDDLEAFQAHADRMRHPGLDRLQRELYATDVAVEDALALLRRALRCRRPPKRLVREAVRMLERAKEEAGG